MRTRFTWIAAVLALVAIGFLIACSTKYSSSSSTNGLVVVPTQGTTESPQATAVMETFRLDLANGGMSQINNVNGPPTAGLPGPVILDPAGAYAYVIVHQNAELVPSVTGIASFRVGSDGKLDAGTTFSLNNAGSVPVSPVALSMDSAGKFLFVADSATSDGSGNAVPGSVSVFAVSSGTLSEVAGSPFILPVEPGGSNPSASALAVTPTAYPVQYSYCSGHAAPTTENLYVADSTNYVLLNYSVDPSAGTLTLLPYSITLPGIPTDQVPSGVAVDPCNRFVYVANAQTRDVSAYTICNAINLNSAPPCPVADFSLHSVGSPFPSGGDNPGPMTVDAYGKFLYVVNTGSNNLRGYVINAITGALTPFTGQLLATGLGPNSIAIRRDDSWLFVANTGYPGTLSQFAITVSSGVLTSVPATGTFDYPTGVAVR